MDKFEINDILRIWGMFKQAFENPNPTQLKFQTLMIIGLQAEYKVLLV